MGTAGIDCCIISMASKMAEASLASSDVMMEFVSSRDFFDRKSHCHTGNQLMA